MSVVPLFSVDGRLVRFIPDPDQASVLVPRYARPLGLIGEHLPVDATYEVRVFVREQFRVYDGRDMRTRLVYLEEGVTDEGARRVSEWVWLTAQRERPPIDRGRRQAVRTAAREVREVSDTPEWAEPLGPKSPDPAMPVYRPR